MRFFAHAALALVSCSRNGTTAPPETREPTSVARRDPPRLDTASNPTRLTADTRKATPAGHTFTAPSGWTLAVTGRVTILTTPERDSHVALVDVQAKTATAAIATAWAEYGRAHDHPIDLAEQIAAKDGWTDIHRIRYRVPPNQQRLLVAEAGRADDAWLVTLIDMSNAVAEKRLAQLLLAFDSRLPKGHTPESFAGKAANRLDDARIAELTAFVETSRLQLGVPGAALGVVQDGKVVFLGGFGVRELGKPAKVDGDTKFMIASNTKALTTLMLAKLVDEKRIAWDSPATSLLPSFRLGDPTTTAKVQVQHLICACTGLPRQDLEWLLEPGDATPQTAMNVLATMQPTSEFGELYQYSNPLAAAAGFVGGHVVFPKLELGKAYDEAMRTRVFVPLGMKATTFDRGRAKRGNWARPHAPDIDGKIVPPVEAEFAAVVPLRPAGGAWSTARDMLAYVQMELASGLLPSGDRYIAQDALLARRKPQVASGERSTYGMGLEVVTKYDVTVVHHGGATTGYYSDVMWLPEHGVGAVILTNGDPGWTIRDVFRRKLLEVLFDGKPQADAEVAAAAKSHHEGIVAIRERLDVPADADVAAALAPVYVNAALGEIAVRRSKGRVMFDFGEWTSEVASEKNADGTVSLVTIAPGWVDWLPFVVGESGGKRTLTLLDFQHEYVFVER
jgi:CubicO group peptidase (beta-lactamase class C family)